jgi:hypothetical protein
MVYAHEELDGAVDLGLLNAAFGQGDATLAARIIGPLDQVLATADRVPADPPPTIRTLAHTEQYSFAKGPGRDPSRLPGRRRVPDDRNNGWPLHLHRGRRRLHR